MFIYNKIKLIIKTNINELQIKEKNNFNIKEYI